MTPESAHHVGIWVIRFFGLPVVRDIVRAMTKAPPSARVEAMGLQFDSVLGMAAGVDKNADAVMGLWALGFDHVEVGTVTPQPQPGNPKPRLFRLIADRGLINRMGFNNDGMVAVKKRLERIRRHPRRPIIGVNIGKNRDTEANRAADDYRQLAAHFRDVADYLVINVSSPNTPGLRALGTADAIAPLVSAVTQEVGNVPVLVKISPDASDQEIIELATKLATLPIAGIIATNTTIGREDLVTSAREVAQMGEGGLSGHPLGGRAGDVAHLVRGTVGDEMCVIGVGGVDTGWDVHRRILAGATLVQLYTAFVYRGPGIARQIHRRMAKMTF
jgi:dihydroorotate dehydrogenase